MGSTPISVTVGSTNISVTIEEGQPISVSFPSVNAGQLLLSDIIDQETPTPAPDGAQTVFTTLSAYRTGTLKVYRDQAKLIRGVDYTETSSTTYTMTVAPDSDENLRHDYIKQ